MYQNTFVGDVTQKVGDLFVVGNLVSMSEDSIKLDISSTSGVYYVIVEVNPFQTESIYDIADVKSLMLLSEDVLGRDWNTKEENEAWKDL